jgi:hypothetical protein
MIPTKEIAEAELMLGRNETLVHGWNILSIRVWQHEI